MEYGKLVAEEKSQSWTEIELEKPVDVSVIIPISERRDDLRELYLQYAQQLSASASSYEVIFILDGPDDAALRVLAALKKEFPEIAVVTLNRWCGEATALSVGFEKARGAVILTLAPYFQVEPHEIGRLLKTVRDGREDLIIGWRYPRIDSRFNRAQSLLFHWILRRLTGIRYHDISCGLRVMKRKVAEEISLYGDLHRFFPLLAHQRGFQIAEVPVEQSARDAKRRVYRPGIYMRRLLDLLTCFFLFKFTAKPLRFFGLIGSGVFGVGVIITSYVGLERILGVAAAGRPLLILGVLLMVFGVQLFSTGLLGEIIIFTHARDVKEYQIKEILD